jgi:hypothetical protein
VRYRMPKYTCGCKSRIVRANERVGTSIGAR